MPSKVMLVLRQMWFYCFTRCKNEFIFALDHKMLQKKIAFWGFHYKFPLRKAWGESHTELIPREETSWKKCVQELKIKEH